MSPRPLLVYDGECAFCRRWIRRWHRLTGDRVEYAPYQQAGDQFAEITRAQFAESVHLRDANGGWTSGAAAALGALRGVPLLGAAAWLYRRFPPFASVCEAFYRQVAANRGRW